MWVDHEMRGGGNPDVERDERKEEEREKAEMEETFIEKGKQ